MKIAHIVNTLPPYWSGTGIVALNLAQALTRNGHDIHIFTPATKENMRVAYRNVKVYRQWTILQIGKAPLTPGILFIKNFDLIHLHHPYYFGAELTLINSVLRRIPFLVTYHNDVIKPGITGNIVSFHSKYIAPVILGKAAKICVMSEKFTEESKVISRYKHTDKLEVIPQGVDTEKFNPGKSSEALNQLTGRNRFILFVRTLDHAHYHSGLSYLLYAMKRINDDVHLVVVGDGPLRAKYEQLTMELALTDRIHFVGAVENDLLPEYYASAFAFILPSEETENAGVVLMEAMASGIPVIGTDVGGTKDVFREGVDGILIPPRDSDAIAEAVNSLLIDPKRAQDMGKSAREHVTRFSSWETISKMYEKVYENVLCKFVY